MGVKLEVKGEVKMEVKGEVKMEVKRGVKMEVKMEVLSATLRCRKAPRARWFPLSRGIR